MERSNHGQAGGGPPGRGRRAPSRRQQRLRRTVVALGVVLLAGAATTFWIYLATRPEPYRPGEHSEEITRALAAQLPEDAPRPGFTDVTESAGLGTFVHYSGDRTSQLPEDMGSGAAWGDFDNDGDQDLFLVSSGGALTLDPSRRAASGLWENRGDGTFRQVDGFPEIRIIGMAAAWGDANGDGWLDLVVTGYDSLRLYRNESGRLVRDERFPEPDGFWAGAAWGDFDVDGDLDLYICGYVQYEEADASRASATMQYGRSVPYTLNPASYTPQRNLLFRNDGEGSFEEVAEQLGVANTEGRSLAALWHDLDDDGLPDLYVANDISDNVLYRNLGERFEEISHAAWVADYRGAMGLAAGDWNRDGDDDLFITHWVAQENALYDSLWSNVDASANGASGADRALRFMDVADQRGLGQIALKYVGWGTEFADFDGDGWLDLIVANGSTFETEETPKWLRPQKPFLFWNRQGEQFHDLAPLSDALSEARVGRGLALADYDDDGDQDILFVHHGRGVQLLRNDMQQGNWMQVELRARGRGATAGFADGARLVATIGDQPLRRAVGSASYLSQSSRVVHFGLGSATRVDELEVRWPSGEVGRYSDLEAGTRWSLTEGDATPRRLSAPGPTGRTAGDERQRVRDFWSKQRAAMQAMKVEGDLPRAIELFRDALVLRPDHEDSRYYLASCLARRGDVREAMSHLEELIRLDPMSHRALRQLGNLRAFAASSPADLPPAVSVVERALEINPEETGALLLLGEIAVMGGDDETAERRLAWACQTNPRAVGGFFLRGYLAWRRGDRDGAEVMLSQAREARGEEWAPEGATAEGDVANRMHEDRTPLSRFWEVWDGQPNPAAAFAELDAYLRDFAG